MEIAQISPTIMVAYLIMYMLMNRHHPIEFVLPEKPEKPVRLTGREFRRQFGCSNKFVRNKPMKKSKDY